MNFPVYFLLLILIILDLIFVLDISTTFVKATNPNTSDDKWKLQGENLQEKCKLRNRNLIGSNLFGDEPFIRKCFSNEDIALLAARKEFEAIIPKDIPMKLLSEEFVKSVMKYFLDSNQLIFKIPDAKSRIYAEKAFYDTVGGYINSYFYPLAKHSFYAGTLCRKTVQHIYKFLDQCKLYLNTFGSGWNLQSNNFSSLNNEIEYLQITYNKFDEDPCNYLILSDSLSYDKDLITYLPKIDIIDSQQELGTIWLPFIKKQYYNLKSDLSSFIVIKYYVVVKKCYDSLHLSSKIFENEFKNWYEDKIFKHLTDPDIYPGLGASLRILKIKTSNPNDLTVPRKLDTSVIGSHKNNNNANHIGLTQYKPSDPVNNNLYLENFESQQNFLSKFRKDLILNKREKDDTLKREKDDTNDENTSNDDNDDDDDDEDDNDDVSDEDIDAIKIRRMKYMIITFSVIAILLLLIIIIAVVTRYTKVKRRSKKSKKKKLPKVETEEICTDCGLDKTPKIEENKSDSDYINKEDEVIIMNESQSVMPTEVPPPKPKKFCRCFSRKAKPKPQPASSTPQQSTPQDNKRLSKDMQIPNPDLTENISAPVNQRRSKDMQIPPSVSSTDYSSSPTATQRGSKNVVTTLGVQEMYLSSSSPSSSPNRCLKNYRAKDLFVIHNNLNEKSKCLFPLEKNKRLVSGGSQTNTFVSTVNEKNYGNKTLLLTTNKSQRADKTTKIAASIIAKNTPKEEPKKGILSKFTKRDKDGNRISYIPKMIPQKPKTDQTISKSSDKSNLKNSKITPCQTNVKGIKKPSSHTYSKQIQQPSKLDELSDDPSWQNLKRCPGYTNIRERRLKTDIEKPQLISIFQEIKKPRYSPNLRERIISSYVPPRTIIVDSETQTSSWETIGS